MELQSITVVNQSTAGISPDRLPVATSSRQAVPASTRATTAADSVRGDKDAVSVDWSTSLFLSNKFSNGNKTPLNSTADAARQAINTPDSTGNIWGNAKPHSDGIVKNYPPFPPGDTQRMKYLKGFVSLRRQIEQLTVPSDESSTGTMQASGEISTRKTVAATSISESGAAQNSRSIQVALAATSFGFSLSDNSLLKQL